MNLNGCTGQLIGPFEANEELIYRIKADAAVTNISYISHIGIQTNVGNIIYINNKPYEIGITGIYEIGNTEISSIYFPENIDNNTIIDYVITFEE